jgi:uncharacterized repeat protein (TIGR03803 family)
MAGLTEDASGALYGTTLYGGTADFGTVFALRPTGSGGYTESVLHSFAAGGDGAYPQGALVIGAGGALFGTTADGGGHCEPSVGCGTVFALTPSGSGYSEQLIYRFHGNNDGNQPTAALVIAKNGDLYGTTSGGGQAGAGTVFKLVPDGSNYDKHLAYSFRGGKDGAHPNTIALYGSRLYGTTTYGGSNACYAGCGTVFTLKI